MKRLMSLVVMVLVGFYLVIGSPMALLGAESHEAYGAVKYSKGCYKVTASDGLNMRKTASSGGKKLCTIKYKAEIKITKFSGTWGYTSYNSKKGWISMDWVKPVEEKAKSETKKAAKYTAGKYKVTASDGLNMRKTASSSGKKLCTIKYKAEIKITKFSGTWGYTSYNSKKGWISMDWVKPVEEKAESETKKAAKYTAGKYKVTASDGLNMRKTASSSGKKLCTIKYKAEIKITKFSGTWGYTSYNSKKGWVSMEWVKKVEDKEKTEAEEKDDSVSPEESSSITISGATKPTTLAVYEPFVIKGKISSKYKLKKVLVGICDSDGKWKESMYVKSNPNKKTFDVNSVDEKILFNNLAKGTYYYKVSARDSKDYSKGLVKVKFSVKASSTKYIWPYGNRSCITQYYESYNWLVGHAGIDIAGPGAYGKDIKAARSGHVMTACFNSSYGYYIVILHSDNYSTVYAHCSKLCIKAGQKVVRGQVIGKVGSTGNSTGPHLHFEVRDKEGVKRNPLSYLP